MATKAVSYLRVSGRGQIDGDGFDRQREAVAKYAKANRLVVVDEFRDEGVSGTNDLDERPGLAAVLDRIESNGVRIVLVENASRLARDLMVQEVILEQFRTAGVKVIAADGGTDLTAGSNEPTSVLIRQVLGAVSQFEKSVLVLKLKAARNRIRTRNGRCEGRKPFGTKDGESEVVDRIKAMRRKPVKGERLSFQVIADRLNAENVPTRTGAKWSAATIRNISGR